MSRNLTTCLLTVSVAVACGFGPCLAGERPERASGTTVSARSTDAPSGSVQRRSEGDSAWIGVWLQDVVDGGVQIVALVPGGPAQLASLRAGDIILAGNGQPMTGQAALNSVLERMAPGDALTIQVLRGDSTIDVEFPVGSRAKRTSIARLAPASPPAPSPPAAVRLQALFPPRRSASLGIEVAEVTPALRVHYGAPEDHGVLVVRSDPAGLAAEAGLAVGDVLVKVGDVMVSTKRQLDGALIRWNTKRPLETRVVRAGEPKVILIDAGLEPPVPEAQDRAVRQAQERELMARKLRHELERLERRMKELRRELGELEEND